MLDCVARDSDGKQMNVEIQQDNEGASPKRARYHSGLIDMNTLNPGQDFDELPMCREMEQIYSEGIESGMEKGELKKAKETALFMAADGMKVEKIAHYLKVSVAMVQKWIKESVSIVQ